MLESLSRRLAVAGEILCFLRGRAFWIAPLVLILVLLALVLFIASQPVVSPFIYTLF